MSYLGSTPTSQSFIAGTDTFSGTGAQTAYTLTRAVNSVNDILVVVNNVDQQPTAYTVSGTTLTFSAAPSSGTNNIYVRYLTTTLQSTAPSQGSVSPTSLTTGGPTWDAAGIFAFNSGYGSAATAYGCRAWVNFNGTGTVAIRASGNVSSITDNGTGDYTVNFATALADANYAPTTSFGDPVSSGSTFLRFDQSASLTTSTRFTVASTTALQDAGRCNVAIFR